MGGKIVFITERGISGIPPCGVIAEDAHGVGHSESVFGGMMTQAERDDTLVLLRTRGQDRG